MLTFYDGRGSATRVRGFLGLFLGSSPAPRTVALVSMLLILLYCGWSLRNTAQLSATSYWIHLAIFVAALFGILGFVGSGLYSHQSAHAKEYLALIEMLRVAYWNYSMLTRYLQVPPSRPAFIGQFLHVVRPDARRAIGHGHSEAAAKVCRRL